MPRSGSKNAFYYFRADFKEKQKRKGIYYENLYELSVAVDSVWRDAHPAIKEKYKEIALTRNEKTNTSGVKAPKKVVPLTSIDKQVKLQEAEDAERKDIYRQIHRVLGVGDIYIMDVNHYCKVKSNYLIGETTILRFNINNGIDEAYHEIINPGYVPLGIASDVKHACIELGLPLPDDDSESSNYLQILSNIFDYLKQKDRDSKILPPIYIMPDKLLPAKDFIQNICNRTGEDVSLFKLYKLDTLFFMLVNKLTTHYQQGFPHESLALERLKKDMFMYTPGIGCAHHEEVHMSIECSMSRVKRLAYIILDTCCPMVGVKMEPGKHFPPVYSMSNTQRYSQQVTDPPIPVVNSALEMSTRNTFTLSEYFSDTLTLGSTNYSHANMEYRPLQMPNADYSDIF